MFYKVGFQTSGECNFFQDTIDTYSDCSNYVDSVNLINGVSDFVSSNSSLSTDCAGRCDWYYNNFLDNSNIISTGNCVHPTVVGDTNSWTGSIFANLNHESWCDSYGTQISKQDSTIFLANMFGE